MLLIQYKQDNKFICGVIDRNGNSITPLKNNYSLYEIANKAITENTSLVNIIKSNLNERKKINYDLLLQNKETTHPLTHYNNTNCFVTGVGLTHINSAIARDLMHKSKSKLSEAEKIIKESLLFGKPHNGQIGARPEWFYKGNGNILKTNNESISLTNTNLSPGEEAELVIAYIISSEGKPYRLGFTIGNELSDHGLEESNHYFLAQSKLLPCSIGNELYIGDIPNKVNGSISIYDKFKALKWQSKFLTGKNIICQSIENIEHYIFQHDLFRNPGDIHYLYLGADKISYQDKIKLENEDSIRIDCDIFSKPLVNNIIFKGSNTNFAAKSL